MEVSKIKERDLIKIGDKIYEVLICKKEADICKQPGYHINMLRVFYLHNIKSKSLLPTHLLIYYPETDEIHFKGKGKRVKISSHEIVRIS